MVHIRLSRKGKKKQPIYRVIVCDKQKDPFGAYLENLGFYNPRTKELKLDADRIKYWISKGAQTSDTIWNLLLEKGLVEGKKRSVSSISGNRQTKMAETKKKEADEIAAKEHAAQATEQISVVDEQPEENPVEEKPAKQPEEKPAEEEPAKQPEEKPAEEEPAKQPEEKPAKTAAEKPVEQPSEPAPAA